MSQPPLDQPPLAGTGRRSSRVAWMAIIALAVVLVLAGGIIAGILLARGGALVAEPSLSPTLTPAPTSTTPASTAPSQTIGGSGSGSALGGGSSGGGSSTGAAASPTPIVPPNTAPVVTALSPGDGTSVGCAAEQGSVPVAFQWATENANAGWIGVNTSNAKVGGFSTIPTTGSLSLDYQCSEQSAFYTLTFEGQGGIVNATITLRR